MSDPTFGISITRVDSEPRPPVWSDMSVVGIIGTAPDADAAAYPLDTPVFLYSDDVAKLTALGARGTLRDAIALVNAQLGAFQAAAKVVLVRVDEGLDTSATIANIVGDTVSTGLSAFLNAGSSLGVIPRLLCAPGFTSQREPELANPVCAALPSICERLLAHAVVDGPATSEQDAIDWRETISSQRLIPVDPAIQVFVDGNPVVQPLSPAIIGVGVRRDHEKQGRPFHSWANQPVQGIIGPSRPINFSLTDGATEAQRLLSSNIGVLLRGEMGVESAIGQGGFIFVGTDNAGEDDLWRFYNVTRGRDFIHLMLLRTLRFYLALLSWPLQHHGPDHPGDPEHDGYRPAQSQGRWRFAGLPDQVHPRPEHARRTAPGPLHSHVCCRRSAGAALPGRSIRALPSCA